MHHKLLILITSILFCQLASAQFLDLEFRDQTVTMEIKQNGFFVRGYEEDATGVNNAKVFQWNTEVDESRFVLESTDDNIWYKIYHPTSGRYVTTSDVSNNGIVTLEYDADSGDSNQEFKFVEQAEEDTYKIHSRHSQAGVALVLSIPNGNTTNEVSLRLMKNDNSGVEGHQKYQLTNVSASTLSSGAILNAGTIVGKDYHITNKATNGQLGTVNGVARRLAVPIYGPDGIFVIEDGSDDGKWYTADKRWFHIRSFSSGKYLTVSGSTSGSAVTLEDLGPNLDNADQQFRLIPAPSGSGWYKLRARLGNLVLEMRTDGSLVVGTPTATLPTNTRQKFAFNLDIPDDPEATYSLVGKQHTDYLTDHGEVVTDGLTPVKRTRLPDPACQWHFIDAGGGYFKIQNALTLQYLAGFEHPGFFGDLGEGRIGPDTNEELYLWELIRKNDHFIIKSKHRATQGFNTTLLGTPPLSEAIVFQNITQANTRWYFYRSEIGEPQSIPEAMDEIEHSPLPNSGCFVGFGSSFKRGLAERVGLPTEDSYFPFIIDALAYDTGLSDDALTDYIQRIDLHSTDHRAYLALSVRNYVADYLAFRHPIDWKASDHAAVDIYKTRIRENRMAYGDRLQDAWSDFLDLTNANGTATTSALLEQLDVNDFVWPTKYRMDEIKSPYYGQYITAAANRNTTYKLLPEGLAVSIGPVASIGTGVAIHAVLGPLGPVAAEALLTKFFSFDKPTAFLTSLVSNSQLISTVLTSAGTVVSVVAVATQILVDQVVNTIEVQELTSDVNNVTDWTQAQIDFYGTITGSNLVQKIFLLEDLDFVIGMPANNEVIVGVPVFNGYKYTNNDNGYFNPTYQITCHAAAVQLDATGQGALHYGNISELITETGTSCGNEFSYSFSITDFDCSDVGQNFVTVTAANDRISKSCLLHVNVRDFADPIARCKNATIVLNSTGNGGINLNDIDDGSSDDCGIVEKLVSGLTLGALDCDDIGTYAVTLTVRDASNRSHNCSASVKVLDTFIPAVTCKTATVQLDATGSVYVPAEAVLSTSYDNCEIVSKKLDGGLDGLTFGCSEVGSNAVTLTIADASGNSASCSTFITVQDNILPDAQCENYTVYLNAQGAGMVSVHNIDNGSSDICGIQTYEILEANSQTGAVVLDCDQVGSQTLTLRVTDNNGNQNTCTATINIQDIIPPSANCINQTLIFNGEDAFQLTVADLLSSEDNCGIADLQLSQTRFDCADLGQTITVFATVTDDHGNMNACTSQVTLTGLPCGFDQQPDGVNCNNGSNASYDVPSDVWTLSSTGCYYTPNSPIELAYTSTEFCGSGELIAQVQSINGGNGWAGITLRESDAPGAKYVQISLNGSNYLRREMRATTNGPVTIQQFPAFNKKWLRLVRNGHQIVAYISPNGVNWQQTMAVNIQMSTCIEAGLMLSNMSPIGTITATFSNVSVSSQANNGLVAQLPEMELIETETQTAAEVYPNPSAGTIHVDLQDDWGGKVSLIVIDQMGRLVLETQVSAMENSPHRLDLSALPSGMYHVMLRNDARREQVERVVLQKQ